jgi:hypothetical protein
LSAIRRRDAATARRARAVARFPSRAGAEFAAELAAVLAELRSVALEVEADARDAVEYAATLGAIGAALFDLAAGEQPELLAESARHYLEAEQLLSTADAPLVSASIARDFADTLRAQAAGRDVDLIEAASYRYRRALDIFRRHGLSSAIVETERVLSALRAELQGARAASGKFLVSDTDVVILAELFGRTRSGSR